MPVHDNMRARLRDDNIVQYPDPIRVSRGDRVTVVRRDERFTRWLWCVASDGRAGWVPETALTSTDPGPSRMVDSYEATELPAMRGALVRVIREFDGWAWVESAEGRRGWMPVTVLERGSSPSDERGLKGESMSDEERVRAIARDIAEAIGRRDLDALSTVMAPGFVHRSVGGDTLDAEAFLSGIEAIPGDIVSVVLEAVTVDVQGDAALVTGFQRAQVRVDAELINDRGVFVDWFVRVGGQWRIRAAVSMPAASA
jgi:ketosteroid isomerase-like protein